MTKEEILRTSWNRNFDVKLTGTFDGLNEVSDLGYEWIYEAMELYASKRTEGLQKEIERLKGEIKIK